MLVCFCTEFPLLWKDLLFHPMIHSFIYLICFFLKRFTSSFGRFYSSRAVPNVTEMLANTWLTCYLINSAQTSPSSPPPLPPGLQPLPLRLPRKMFQRQQAKFVEIFPPRPGRPTPDSVARRHLLASLLKASLPPPPKESCTQLSSLLGRVICKIRLFSANLAAQRFLYSTNITEFRSLFGYWEFGVKTGMGMGMEMGNWGMGIFVV